MRRLVSDSCCNDSESGDLPSTGPGIQNRSALPPDPDASMLEVKNSNRFQLINTPTHLSLEPMKAELVPDNGDPPIPITRDLTVVGRRKGFCDVVIDDPSLSKRHCVLVKTDGLLVIRDLGTTNGTKVKGQKIRWAALLPDDRISLGSYKLRVYLGSDDALGPSERRNNKAGNGHQVVSTRPVAGSATYSGHLPTPTGPVIGFAEPSPLEVVSPASIDNGTFAGSGSRQDSPLDLEIQLDEDDEIIELD